MKSVKICLLLVAIFFISNVFCVEAQGDVENNSPKEYKLSSAKELSSLNLKAGDKVILLNGDWSNQELVFKGKGTEKMPIILVPEIAGEIKLIGNSSLVIEGEWLIVDGLFFTDGYIQKGDIIKFGKNSKNCRLTNTAIIEFNNPDNTIDNKWISLYGERNRVDHCYIEGKKNKGATLVVWLSDKPNYHQIDHNYFGERTRLGSNGGESIRIGTGAWAFYDSFTTVENNIFYHCNGEVEIISNKTCNNIIRNNLFYESQGTLTLRNGTDATVYGNYFIGNGIKNTGGIRIIGYNHKVYNNYFQGLKGAGVRAAISIMNGLLSDTLHAGYLQVKNAYIHHNLIIDSKEGLCVGAGDAKKCNIPPINTLFTDNKIINCENPLTIIEKKADISFDNNIVWNSLTLLPKGFENKNPNIEKDAVGMYWSRQFPINDRFWMNDTIGVLWDVSNRAQFNNFKKLFSIYL